ncbi:MAG: hypothetical protein JWO85_3460 [Candidatus Eremiobacteraeota bacterium]|nr:hypothetical protein [Candidatus Eremiobacteraeota bacterium]
MTFREFSSLRTFAEHSLKMATKETIADPFARRVVSIDILATARHMIGRPEYFSPLAQSTVNERLRLGYVPYATLLRSGNYERSFGWTHAGRFTSVGSTSPLAVFHELGGRVPGKPPKRSVLVEPTIKRDVILFELFAKTYFLEIGA